MKKLIGVILLLTSSLTLAITEATNHTIMFPKEAFGSYAMHEASWHNMVYDKQTYGSACQVYTYFQSSLPEDHASEYFSFDNIGTLEVQGGLDAGNDITTQSFKRNILGQWLGLDKDFKGSFSITPEQKQYGATIAFSQDFKGLTDISLLEHLSIGISLPITVVENKLKFQGSQEILDALQGKNTSAMGLEGAWQYLKLNPETQSSTDLANVKFNLGTKYQSEDDILIATNTTLTIPLVTKVSNRNMFEPIVGYNGHFVMGSNVTFQFPLLVSKAGLSRICWFFGIENKFLSTNHQMRTFEIRNKPFSRYMPIYDRHLDKAIPGVNAFTKDCDVEPFNLVNFITGMRFKYKESVGEIGYELWGHGTERITIRDDNKWDDARYGIAHITDENGAITASKTASTSTINYVGAQDATNVYIKKTDLNMDAAAASTAIVHRGYASVGFAQKGQKRDCFMNLGLFIEATQNNAALNNWGGWFKLGFSF